MTVEKLFPMAGQITPQMFDMMALPIMAAQPVRTRHHSGGSTGSYGSTGSCSSYGSDKPQLIPAEFMSADWMYRLKQQVQNQAMSQAVQQQQQQQQRQKRTERPQGQGQNTIQKNVNTTRYKTEMCRPFEESGYCKYGEKCQFAHGNTEQRNLSRHPKYKTELCRTYHTVGFCPYGPRCHFIHNEDEYKLTEITHMKQNQVLKQVAEQFIHQQQQAQQQQHLQQHVLSLTTQVQTAQDFSGMMESSSRPTSLDMTSSSVLPLSLGSTLDTPPSSVTNSPPSMSPTSMMSDDVFSGVPTPPPGFNSPPALSNVFNFHNLPRPVAPVPQAAPTIPQISSATPFCPTSPLNINVANLAATLQAVTLNPATECHTVLKDCLQGLLTPPMSTEDFRLPIFSQMVGTL